MKERGGILAWVLMALVLFLWLRFLFHMDPRFPGSLIASALGIVGSLIMLVPLLYSGAKRIVRIRGSSLRTFLTVHIYAGLLGPILVLVHTGHKFDNPVGVLLTMMTLIVVGSGFVGRYLLQACSRELGEKRKDRTAFEPELRAVHAELAPLGNTGGLQQGSPGFLRMLFPWLAASEVERAAIHRARAVASAAAAATDTSIRLHERMQRWFRLWMGFHLVLTAVLYFLLATHVFIVVYYGLRWLPV